MNKWQYNQHTIFNYFYLSFSEDPVAATGTGQRFFPGLTGRGVTIATLMTEDIIQPGEKVMSLEYLVRSILCLLLVEK